MTGSTEHPGKPFFRLSNIRGWVFLLVVAAWLSTEVILIAQTSQPLTRKELEEKRKRLQQEIKQTTAILNQISKNKQATYHRYQALQEQIAKRLELIGILEEEVDHLSESIERTSGVVEALNGDIDRLKNEYSGMVRHAYRQRLTKSRPLFLLSASSFNNAFQRWQYLRQYDHYRKKQARLIVETEKTLRSKLYMLEQRRSDKEFLLGSARRQSELLSLELEEKDRMLQELQEDELHAKAELRKKERDAQKLNEAIEKIIKEEMERSRSAVASTGSTPNAPAAESLSKSFAGNKGRLPWPVKKGFLTGRFGVQQHPTIKSVKISNNGVDISTEKGAEVYAVFDGKVVSVQYIPGFQYVVIIQHGTYYTVYARLEEVKVKKDDTVKTRSVIGVVNTDAIANTTEIHFEVWRDKQRLDPETWISK
ncbi:MAG: peptidoglycan DD-metalloendopeptidase family protein [Saprospiraceae bacterium]